MKRRAWLAMATGGAVASQQPLRDSMPRFQARSLDGEMFTRDSLKGKVVLVQYWATWCGYCRKDEPAIEQILKDHANEGLIVLAVNAGEEKSKVQEYLKGHARTARVVLAPETTLAPLFGGTGVPAYILMDREGKVAATQGGSGGLLALRDMLKEVDLRK